jgi:N-acetylglutamate synthase-like GNAT family acetyltransferase
MNDRTRLIPGGRRIYYRAMNSGQLRIRRATVDDLPVLKSLWLAAKLPAEELENRLTDFHIIENNGAFGGALGVEFLRQHARIHSEDYPDFSLADAARELFWERVQVLAANHGIFRLWTQETSPFWRHQGFQTANAETLARLPAEWKKSEGSWLTLQLKNEDAINAALKDQFADFMEAEKQQTKRVVGQARMIRIAVTIAGFLFFVFCLGAAVLLMMRHPLHIR